jgi:hypothetical protein
MQKQFIFLLHHNPGEKIEYICGAQVRSQFNTQSVV